MSNLVKKIIIQINGGLGNQFFQYAVGRAISLKNGLELKLDLSEFEDYKIRKYELSNFNIKEKFATEEEVVQLNKKRFFKKTLFKEKNCKYNPKILKIKDSAYLKGYWQSERYFKEVEDVIRTDFTFKNFDFIQNKDIFDEITQKNSVSINFRGCEYVNNPDIAKIHNICGQKYYDNAIKYVKERVQSPVFYVFSDDMERIKSFKFDVPVIFVETANWQEDLYFMQNCKHNIIANSSFSWWAAWLNQNQDKIVVAPDKWFSDSSKLDYKNIVPTDWIKVNSKR